MTISELLEKYQFHDSTLENVRVLNGGSVELVIDVCLWMQRDYRNEGAETQMQRFLFEGAAVCAYDECAIDSDSILEARAPDERTLELALLRQSDESCHILRVSADSVRISAENVTNKGETPHEKSAGYYRL